MEGLQRKQKLFEMNNRKACVNIVSGHLNTFKQHIVHIPFLKHQKVLPVIFYDLHCYIYIISPAPLCSIHSLVSSIKSTKGTVSAVLCNLFKG